MSPFYLKIPEEVTIEECTFIKNDPVEYLKKEDIDNLRGIYDINLNYSKREII